MGDISILDRVPSIADFVLVRVDKELSVVHRKTLQVVSKFLKQSLSENDFIARWGGEEFVMLLPQAQMADIDKKLNEVRTKLAAMPFKFKQEKVKIKPK